MAKEWSKPFYNSKVWKIVRKQALRRDHYTCCRCYSRATEVHHIQELTPGNIHDHNITLNLQNLESLCHDCHTKETKGVDGDIQGDYIFDFDGQVVRRQ